MRQPLPEDEFAEVAVVRNEDAPLSPSNRQHLGVLDGSGVVKGDNGNVMPLCPQGSRERAISALIKQELHVVTPN